MRAGDREVARRLVEFLDQHEPMIRRLLAPHLRAEPALDADDLLQEVRIRVWRMLGDEKKSSYAAFSLARIVASCVIDQHRRRQVRAEVDGQLPEELPEAGSPQPGPMRLASQKQAVEQVQAALARLPARRRRPAALLLQGFSVEEIATIEQLSPAQARNLAYRGINELQLRLRSAGVDLDEQQSDGPQ